ncbi:MAG: hypothetical protein L0922_00040 [Candidatus Mariimomonas ferrooxydans]
MTTGKDDKGFLSLPLAGSPSVRTITDKPACRQAGRNDKITADIGH